MKLEPKHIIPYLPDGIPAKLSEKGIFNQDDEFPNPRTKELGIIKNISFWHPEITGQLHISDTYSFDFDEIDEIDIVLRPLSDLTKEIEVNGERFVPMEKLGFKDNYDLAMELFFKDELEELPYRIILKLFEWHFDVFGLIEKGLAIDINTLNK